MTVKNIDLSLPLLVVDDKQQMRSVVKGILRSGRSPPFTLVTFHSKLQAMFQARGRTRRRR